MSPHSLNQRRAVAVFVVFAFAYFLSTLVRAITATLSPTLVDEFGLQARELGLLAGGYFLGFAATQLPMGHWLDRYGPKRVLMGFLLVAVVGSAAFAMATGFSGLLMARILTGVGVSACLMAPLTGYRRWMDPAFQLRANSWMLMTGALGMLCSTLPVQWLLPVLGWRPLFWVLAGLTVLAVLLIGWVVPRWQGAPAAAPAPTSAAEPASPPQGDTGLWSSYRVVWRHPYFRRMVPLGVITYGGMLAMQTLWAGPWLVRVSGYSPLEAATGLFTLNAFMLVTFWAWGYFNPRLAAAGWSADRVITWGAPLNLLALLFLIYRGPEAGPLTWTLFCMTNSCMSLAQPAVGMAFPPAQAGRALSGYNLVMFSGVFAAQWGIGLLIDGFMRLDWTVVASFQGALAVYGVLSAIAYVHFLRRAGDNANVAP